MCVCVCVCVCVCELRQVWHWALCDQGQGQVILHLPHYKHAGPLTKICHMDSRIKIKNVAYKNIINDFNVMHCEIKVKVFITLAKFNHHLICQITSRWR